MSRLRGRFVPFCPAFLRAALRGSALLLLCALLPACAPAPKSVTGINELQQALADTGWPDIECMRIASGLFSEAGITEAALLADGDRRLEVYRVPDEEKALTVAGIFAASGDPVFLFGPLIVLVPSGPAQEASSREIMRLGFQPAVQPPP